MAADAAVIAAREWVMLIRRGDGQGVWRGMERQYRGKLLVMWQERLEEEGQPLPEGLLWKFARDECDRADWRELVNVHMLALLAAGFPDLSGWGWVTTSRGQGDGIERVRYVDGNKRIESEYAVVPATVIDMRRAAGAWAVAGIVGLPPPRSHPAA